MEQWHGVWRRSQNLAVAYARRFPNQRVLYVEAAIDYSHALRTGKQHLVRSVLNDPPLVRETEYSNLSITTPPKFLPDSLPFGRQINNSAARRHVRRAMRECKTRSPIFWINPPGGWHYAGKMGEQCVLYDIGDDWNAIRQSRRAMRWTRQEDELLTERADAVLVVSDYLFQQKSAFREDVFLIPNGIDAERYADIWKRTLTPHPVTAQWKHPVLGYTGMLHAERLDTKLLLATAKAMPETTLALVGPNFLDAARTQQLQAVPNIVRVDAVPYHEVPSMMAAFDVCLVPNLINDFSESQNPMKLWEYLASGLPIVATNVAGFRDYPGLVRIANTPQEFIESIELALKEGTAKATLRQAAVEADTWETRLAVLLEAIDYAEAKRSEGQKGNGTQAQ